CRSFAAEAAIPNGAVGGPATAGVPSAPISTGRPQPRHQRRALLPMGSRVRPYSSAWGTKSKPCLSDSPEMAEVIVGDPLLSPTSLPGSDATTSPSPRAEKYA